MAPVSSFIKAFYAVIGKEDEIEDIKVTDDQCRIVEVGLEGCSLEALFEEDSVVVMRGMLDEAASEGVTSGQVARMRFDGRSTQMILFATLIEERTIMLGGATVRDLLDLILILAEERGGERKEIMKEMLSRMFLYSGRSESDIVALDQISRLNNEIVNSQRQLANMNSQLRAEKERNNAILTSIGDGVVALDMQGRVVFTNDAAARMTGFDKREALGKKAQEVLILVDAEGGRCYLHWLEETMNVEEGDGRLPTSGVLINRLGGIAQVEVTYSHLLGDSGTKEGSVVVIRDVSEWLRVQNELNELNQRLKLTNKMVRHDISNDLMVIRGWLALFQKNEDTLMLEKMEKALQKAEGTIEKVSELDSPARRAGNLQTLSLATVIESIMRAFDLPHTIQGDDLVLADPALYSVVENLVRNAIMHGKAKRVDFIVTREGSLVKMKVIDDGQGVAEEVKDTLFQEGVSYGDAKGSGMGLHIVKRIMERYGGDVSLSDNLPHGANFELVFMVADAHRGF